MVCVQTFFINSDGGYIVWFALLAVYNFHARHNRILYFYGMLKDKVCIPLLDHHKKQINTLNYAINYDNLAGAWDIIGDGRRQHQCLQVP